MVMLMILMIIMNQNLNLGCDAVMIGRGSYGRPWIFEEIKKFSYK